MFRLKTLAQRAAVAPRVFASARFLSTPATTAPPLANSSRYEDQPVPGHLIFTHEDDTTEVVTAHMEMTLEWLVDSPPELHLFDEPPIIKETTECYTGPRD